MFLMLIIRPQIFECNRIPRSHADTLWHQKSCWSVSEKSGGRKSSSASQPAEFSRCHGWVCAQVAPPQRG